MASTPDQRQRDERAAFSARFGVSRFPVLAVAALVVAAVTASSVVLAQLASWRTPEHPATPRFLTTALGAPQADAPLVREPAAGVVLAADDESLTFRHGRSTLALRGEHGSGAWSRFARGAARPTEFGSQTVVFRGERGLEDYLRVERRLGTRTWRWHLDTDATPSLRTDGTVWFTNGTADAGFHIAPVEVYDDRGRAITPDGLRWTLARHEGSWSLELSLDDRDLPVPYVIDPAIAVNGANTANGTSPLAPARPGASGDLLIAHVFVRGTGTITAPAGWTQIQNAASANVRQATYWAISDGTNSTSFSWTGAGTNAGVAVVAYTNPHPTSPIQASTTNTGTGTTATATGVTTSHPNEWIATFFGQATNSAVAAPTGLTQDYTAIQSGAQAGRLAITGASAAQASAGASGDKTTTAAAEWMAQLVAIRQRPDDGSGSISTTTTALPASSTGNTITFTYTAGTQGLAAGSVAVDVPGSWSAPSTTTTAAGYTTASTGTVGVSGQRITVTGVTLAAGATMTITYGSKASGGPGATASSTTGGVTWSALSRGSSVTGTALAALSSSPSITQVAADGSGTMSVSPTTVTVAGTTTLTFTYTAAAGAMSGGTVTIAVPASWTAPNTTGGTAGYTTATGGSGSNAISFSSGVLTISGVTLSSGATLTVAYGTGAGGAVTVPAGTGAQTWTTQQRSLAAGTLTSLASSPQTTKNNAPTATVSLSPASPTTNQTLTATATRSDLDGDAVTLTYVWKVNGSTVKTTSGSASLTDTLDLSQAGNGDKGQTVSVEVTPSDSKVAGTTVSDSKVVANSAPTISSVTIDQASPKTNDTLSVTAVSADADGDARTYAYQWRKDGVDLPGATGATLDLSAAGNGGKGDSISVRVTASDGTASSSPTTSSGVTIANSAPVVDSVSIDQAAPKTNDTLSLTASSHDDDGDAVTYAYQWTKNGVDLSGATGSTLNLATAGNGDVGDLLRARVTGSDGAASSTPLTSSPVTVANTAPTATVSLGPASPTTNQTLTATATRSDLDGDAVTLTYVWKVNGSTVKTTSGSASLTDTLDLSQAGNGDKGQTVSVEVTPNDGSASGSMASDSQTVANTAPTITSVAIDQPAPATGDALTVSVASADADSDSRTYAYQWRRNGVDISGATTATLDLSQAGNGDKGDALSVRVTASDGSASSAPSTSSAVTVQNSAPAMTSVAIDQASPATNDTLSVTVASTDADGDTRTYAYQWRRNGVDIPGATTATLDLSQAGNGDRGDTIGVRVTASDGAASSAPLTSTDVTVQNSAPTITSAAVDQPGPKTNDVLTVTVASADADGDARSYAYQWRRNGVDISGATNATLDLSQAGNGGKGDTISVRVTASDGSASSAPSTSAGVVVQNSAPTITSVTIDQASPKTNDTLSVTVVSTDADGDARTYGHQWAKGGVDRLAETAAGYDLSLIGNGDRGDAITVRVVASDGTDTSAPATSAGVTVANTAPVLSGVAIDQPSPQTNDTLTATVTATDADGDTLAPTRQWRRNGVDLGGETGATLDLSQAGNGDKGDQLTLRVSVSDGTASDGPATSPAVTVQNASPTITSASIDQASPHTNATLTVSVASADADGDARSYAYQWRRNGVDLAGETGATLDLSQAGNGGKGDAIAVRVTASDGGASSAPTTTTAVTVANSLATATASVAPASPTTNQTLTATATKADADGDTVTLSYVWKVNGVVRKTTAGSASLTDTFDLSGAGDGDKGQTVSVEVTPNDGDGDGSAASDSVTVANSAPTATATLAPSSPTTDQTLTATATKADPDGDTVTLTYVWKVNGVVRKTTAGSSSLTDTLDLSGAGDGDRGQTVSVEVTPNDGGLDGSTASDAETIANAAPTLSSAVIDQGSPHTNDTLTVSVTSADADGDARTYAYQWRRNGVDIAGATSSTLDLSQAGNGDRGDAISVRVVATDGTASSAPLTSASATVLNSAPTATVGLPAVPVGTNDTIAASATQADADGDTVTLTYVWKVNGATVQTTPGTASLTDTLDLSQAGHGDRGDTVSVELTPNDGSIDGTAATDSVGVDNALPTTTVALSPASPTTNQTLTATATKGDTDGDAVTLSYVWKVNGVVRKTTAASASLTDTFDLSGAGNGGRGDTVAVEVTPNDGTADGSAVTDSTSVANAAPTATVSLSPAAPKTDELVTATATKADVDGDAVTLTYRWKVDGTTVKTTSGSVSLTDTLDLAQAGNGDRGQTVSVEVTPEDGTATGSPATDAATVVNSAPVLSTVSIDQASPRTNDTLSFSFTATDADGDTLTPARQWRRNGGDLSGQTGATLDLSAAGNGDRGDQLALRLSLSDGSASSATLTSAAVTVANSAPTVVSATIDQPSPLTNGALTVTVVTSDPDGDARTNAYQWAKNGVDRFGETASGYDLSLLGNGDRGDQVAVRIVASDGTDTSAPVTSAAVTVANSEPVVDSVSIVQSAPRTNDTLTLSATGHDDDGDTVTWAYQWWRNGADLAGETGGSLDLAQAGNGDEGDQLAVRVVGSDGTAPSAPLTSAAVVVLNTAPTATVSLAPASPTTNQTLTATATKADVDGDTITLTYVWKVNGVVRKTTAGSASLTDTFDLSGAGDGDRGQTVSVEVTPDDGAEAGSAVSDSVAVANSAPTVTSVAIDQASPATGDTLSVSVTSADADGDGRTYAYQWRRNGVDLAGETGATLDLSHAGNGDSGDTISVRVTADDGSASSAPSTSAAVTVQNSAPTMTSAAIDQATPRTDDVLTVSVSSADADGDGPTYAYQWRRNGVDLAGATSATLDLAQAGNGDKGDAISVRVTASDGSATSTPATSAAVTVLNTAPTVTSVAIDQGSPATGDTLTVSVSSADADGDPRTYAYQWRRNGVDLAGETGATLDLSQAGNGDRGDALSVRVTADDGAATSAASTSAAVTVANSAPAIASVSVDQAAPRTNDLLTVTVVSSDADGDARTYAYQWRRNGTDLAGETGATLDLSQAGNGDKGDAVSIRVTASDGSGSSAPSTSAAVTVQNTAPTITSVAIDQAAPRTNDTLTATIAATDADGDTLTTGRQWRKNGTDLSGETAATLDLSTAGNGDKGDQLTLRVTLGDGSASSAPATSAAVTVLNTAPTVTSVAIDQAAPRTNDTLTATIAATDADGDTLTTGRQWRKNGTDLSGETAAALDLSTAGNGDKGDQLTLRVTVGDGTTSSAPSTSASVTVQNTAPTCSATSLATTEGTPADAAPLCTDADGDALTPAIASQGTRGVASVASGQLHYVPGPGESGSDSFTYRAGDGTDQSAPAAVAVTIDDVTAPETTIDAGPAQGSVATTAGATFAFSADASPATFECRLDGGSWAACTTPRVYSGLAEGAHTFEVRATDDAANTDQTPATRGWTIDTLAPETTLDGTPNDPSNDATPSFAFSSEPGATFEARLDGGGWTPATSPLALGPLADGSHTLEVRAIDAAGNADASPGSYAWTVDTAAPSVTLDDPGANLAGTVTLTATASDADSGVASVVFQRSPANAGTWTTIAASWDTTAEADGLYDLRAIATDGAGNATTSALVEDRLVDNASPDTTLDAAPADPDNDATPTFAFSSSETGSTFECRIDGGAWSSCASPLTTATLPDGARTFEVRAIDASANPDPSPAVHTWALDTVAPAGGSITVGDGWDTDGSVAIATDNGTDTGGSGVAAASAVVEREAATLTTGSCGTHDAAWSAVATPDASVAGGACYRYRLRVRDNAGNWATFGSASVVKVDLTAPTVPSLALADVTGTLVVGSTVYFKPGTSGSFTVTPASGDPESGGVTFSNPNLGTGWSHAGTTWSFGAAAGDPNEPNNVTATNAAGLTSAAASFTVTADATAPVTTATVTPAANGLGWHTATPVGVTLDAADAGAGVKEIRYTTDGSVPGPTSPVYAAPVDVVTPGTTTLTFRAEDNVGNLETPSTVVVRIDTTAPTTPTLAYSGFTNASFDGTVVWFRPGAAGGFTVTPSASDPESGVASHAFPALGGGWSNSGGTYAFTSGAPDPVEPNEVVTTNGAGLSSAGAPITVTADSTAPVSTATCNAAACSAGWYTAKPVTVVLTASDVQSGLDRVDWSTDGSAPASEYLGPLSLGAEGTTTVRFAARDEVGNVEGAVSQDVRIDTVAPAAATGAVAPYLRGTVALSSTQSDATSGVGSVQFQIAPAGTGTWTNVPATWDTTGTANGQYDVRVRVTDVAGNVTDATPVTSRWVDNLAPTITLDPPTSPASGSVLLTSTANDAHSGLDTVEYAYSAAGANDWRTTALTGALWDTTQLADGDYDVRARATDRSGNASGWSVVAGIAVDNSAPTVSVTAPLDGSFVNAADADPFTLAATAGDAGTGVATVEFLACATAGPSCSSWTSVDLDTSPAYTGAWTLPGDGVRQVKAVATDNAGHTAEAVVTVTVDRSVPAAALTAPSAGANVRGTIALAQTSADATSGVASVDFQRSPAGAASWSTIPASWDTTGVADGLYDLRVLVTDVAGNTRTDVAANVRVDNTAPSGTLVDPGQYLRGTLALTGSAADAGSGVASVAFQRSPEGAGTWTTIDTDTNGGDGWSATFDTAAGATPDGRYDLRVVVTDNAGNAVAHALPARTIDNTKPSAAIASPGANLRLTVTLGGTADDATSGVANVTFEYDNGGGWQLISTDGDGSDGWSASLNTTLPATPDGLYAFRLTATDRAGNQETSLITGRRIDNTAPTASFTNPGPYLMGAVQLTASATDAGSGIDAVRFERSAAGSGGPWTQVGPDASFSAGAWRSTWNTSPDGLYDLRVIVDDDAGNRTVDTVASRRVDNTAPVTTDDAAPGRHNTNQTVTLSRSDAGSGPATTQYRVRTPGGSFGSWLTGTSVTILASGGDGVYAIEYFSTDAAGNVESVKSTDVLIDTTGPSGTVTDPSTYLRGLVTLTATADDPADVTSVRFEYAPEGTAAWTQIGTDLTANGSDEYTVDWDTTGVADIAYDLQVTFLDSVGNPTVQSLTGKTVDNELPGIALTAPPAGAVRRNVIAITANAADGVSGMREVRFEVKPAGAAGFSQVDVDNGSSPYSTAWDSTGSADGPTDLRVIAVDQAGNLRSATTTIFVDNNAPTLTVSAPSTAVSGTVTLTAAGSSDIQTVVFKVGGSAIGTDNDGSDGFSTSWSTVGDGNRVVTAEATDVGGNVGTSAPVTVQVDNTAPTGAMTLPADGAAISGTVALAASASDAGSGVSGTGFQFKRTSDSTWTAIGGSSWDTTAVATGAYDLRARITDNAGNAALTGAITVQVVPPPAIVTPTPTPPAAPPATTAPSDPAPFVVASTPADGAVLTASPGSIDVSASERVAAVTGLTLNGGAVRAAIAGSEFSVELDELDTGAYTLAGTLVDASGKTTSFRIHFTVVIGSPATLPFVEANAPADAATSLTAVDGASVVTVPAGAVRGGADWLVVRIQPLPASSVAPARGGAPTSAVDVSARWAIAGTEVHSFLEPLEIVLPGASASRVPATLEGGRWRVLEPVRTGTGLPADSPDGYVRTGDRAHILTRHLSVFALIPAPAPPRLAMSVTTAKTFSWSTRGYVAARVKVSRAANLTATLVGPSGTRLRVWHRRVDAGASVLRLPLPGTARTPGAYRIVVTASAGGRTVRRTLALQIVRRNAPNRTPGPTEVALAADVRTRRTLALGFRGTGTRLIAADADGAFTLAARGHVRVVLVDVDRHGTALVRDLHAVFPSLRLLALASRSADLRAATRAGADAALPRSASAARIARVLRRLAR